jgi:hypothetical protein
MIALTTPREELRCGGRHSDDEDRTRSKPDEALRNAADDDARKARAAVRADDEELGADLRYVMRDDARRRSLEHGRLGVRCDGRRHSSHGDLERAVDFSQRFGGRQNRRRSERSGYAGDELLGGEIRCVNDHEASLQLLRFPRSRDDCRHGRVREVGRSHHDAARSDGSRHEHVRMGVSNDVFSDAPEQQAREPRRAAASDDDEIGVPGFGPAHDLCIRAAPFDEDLGLGSRNDAREASLDRAPRVCFLVLRVWRRERAL